MSVASLVFWQVVEQVDRGLSPEIAYWRAEGDDLEDVYQNDWYIKGSYGLSR